MISKGCPVEAGQEKRENVLGIVTSTCKGTEARENMKLKFATNWIILISSTLRSPEKIIITIHQLGLMDSFNVFIFQVILQIIYRSRNIGLVY